MAASVQLIGRAGLIQALGLMKSIVLTFLLALSGGVFANEPPKPPFNLIRSDADLIRHIQHTNHIFVSALGGCSNDKVERSGEGKPTTFVYTATCAIKPLSDTPCPAYSVMATGIIDTPYSATVHSLTLALLCPGQ
jgi:hypothetical protein